MNEVFWVRWIGRIEGVSWLLLLFVAMPLKYGFGQPLAVRVVGSAHGALFVTFCAVLGWAHLRRRWAILRSLKLFLAALIPFGFLAVDRGLEREELALAPRRT
jgi:integral membrane protein